MPERVRVRRDHPGALTWTIAMVLTMLAVYLITLGGRTGEPSAPVSSQKDTATRVTEELSFEGIDLACVSFGTFETAQEARVEAARFTARGAAGYILEDGGFSVLAAGYEDAQDAQRVADSLSESEDIPCAVCREEASGVRLRITATQEQIQAITGADAALRRHARDLRELALMLDRSETQPSSACTLIAVMAGQLTGTLTELRAIPGGQESPVVRGLIALAEHTQAALSLLSTENSDSPLSLSGKIKYNHIETTLLHIDYLNTLNGS